ncbi:Dom-3 Z [Mortierella sp. AD032]|nr:Dom-3 Z [Mortierella sp. AD032]
MDDSQLKHYFPPDLTKPNNLSVNYEKYISRDLTVDEHIDALLDALICIREREQEQGDGEKEQNATSMTQANFICYRGLLTKIMCTPYARNEPWEMGATLYNGSIYIEEHVSAEKRENAAGHNDRHKLMSYWGYRFETICNISKPISELRRIGKTNTRKRSAPSQLSGDGQERGGNDSPQSKVSKLEDGVDGSSESQKRDEESNKTSNRQVAAVVQEEEEENNEEEVDDLTTMTGQIDLEDPELTGRLDGIVDTNLQYCTVARTKIGSNSIIMGAEVDCTSEPKKAPPHNPLSNYIELKTSRVISNAREQNSFERHKLLKFWAQSFLPGIPTIIVGFRDDDGNVITVENFKTMEIPRLDTTICINFLDAVLNFLRKQIKIDNPNISYTIRWAPPYKAIEVEYKGESTSFLTDRFLKSQK